MTGSARIVRANARNLPLADNSVDLVVTSPPYFALRSYQDGGAHYQGQIGDEPTPTEFVASLLEVTRECVRVLKPSGSLWVNLGDKYVADNRGSGFDVKRGDAKHAPAARLATSQAGCGKSPSWASRGVTPSPASTTSASSSALR
jgi:DNA modification methylase